MSSPLRRAKSRPRWERALLLALLLPALLLGSVLAGQTVWLHSHVAEKNHVHFAPETALRGELADLETWHRDQHEHEDREHRHENDHAPAGLLFQLPPVDMLPGHATGAELIGPCSAAIHAVWNWHLASVGRLHRPALIRSGWPPERGERSGVAALLRSSHALLI